MATSFRLPPSLPTEIITKILIEHINEGPVCALDLLCPEWNLCRRPHRRLEEILRVARVDTYTLPQPGGGGCPGRVSTTFDHGPGDHLCLPRLRDPRGALDVAGLPPFLRRELVRAWAGTSVVVASQRFSDVVAPLWAARLPREVVQELVILREPETVRLLPFDDDFVEPDEEPRRAWAFDEGREVAGQGRWDGESESEREEEWEERRDRRTERVRICGVDGFEKERLPPLEGEGEDCEYGPRYLFQRLRHLVVNSVPDLVGLRPYELGSPSNTRWPGVHVDIAQLEERLDYERRANLLLRWQALEQLESLFLDLRGYSCPDTRYLDEEDVIDLACSLRGKNLALLVIAGLRSWEWYPGLEAMTIEDVGKGAWNARRRAWVDEERDEVNWWLMFAPAVRPGGRLVLVDKLDGGGVTKLRRPRTEAIRLREAEPPDRRAERPLFGP